MNRAAPRGAVLLCAWLVAAHACTRRPPESPKAPASNVGVGECGDPSRDGVVSESPEIARADRDLDGAGAEELIAADRSLCGAAGNCHWNVFAAAGDECPRYVGTIAGAAIERLDSRGEDGFYDLRGWWQLAGDERVLMQEYSFRRGSYRVIEAVPCVTDAGGRVLCGARATAEP